MILAREDHRRGAELGAVELSHRMDAPHGSGVGQSGTVGWGTPWLQCGTDTVHGGHHQVTPLPLITYFICLTMVLFPDSPAPKGTKQNHGGAMGTPSWAPCWLTENLGA